MISEQTTTYRGRIAPFPAAPLPTQPSTRCPKLSPGKRYALEVEITLAIPSGVAEPVQGFQQDLGQAR